MQLRGPYALWHHRHPIFAHGWTRPDTRQQYYSNKGSICGLVSDHVKELAFYPSNRSTKYPSLFR